MVKRESLDFLIFQGIPCTAREPGEKMEVLQGGVKLLLLRLHSEHGLAEMIFEDQAGLHALGAGIGFSVPAELGDSLQLGHDKIIAKIESKEAVGWNLAIQLDAHSSLAVIQSQRLLRKRADHRANRITGLD